MSRVGKKLINIPSGVDININDAKLTIKGKHGLLEREINPSLVSVDLVENTLSVKCIQVHQNQLMVLLKTYLRFLEIVLQ